MKILNKSVFLSSMMLIGTLAAGIVPDEASAAEFTQDQMKKMGIFLSNFTECSYTKITRGSFIDNPSEMVHFAVCHNWINNQKRFNLRKNCGKEKSEGDFYAHIDPKFIRETIKKYLDYDFKEHKGYEDYISYDGYTYCMPAGDGEETPYVKVVTAKKQNDGTILITGSSYYPEVEEADSNVNVRAVVRPYVWNGKNTWSLVSLDMDPKPYPDVE